MIITQFIIEKSLKHLSVNFIETTDIKLKTQNTQLSFEYLRISSPAHSRNNKAQGDPEVICHKKNILLLTIESVAKHGYRLIFDDGHEAIYSEEYIHTLALEFTTRWQHYLDTLKASGHTRESLIQFKQL